MPHKQTKQRGFVLLLSLVLLFLLSLIIFSAIEDSQLQYKMVSAWQTHLRNAVLTRLLLSKISEQVSDGQTFNCMTKQQSEHKNSQWWHSKAVCHINIEKQALAYVIALQQYLPCAFLMDRHAHILAMRGVQFYRITAVMLSQHNIVTMMQISVATAAKQTIMPHCTDHQYIIRGLQSWVELSV